MTGTTTAERLAWALDRLDECGKQVEFTLGMCRSMQDCREHLTTQAQDVAGLVEGDLEWLRSFHRTDESMRFDPYMEGQVYYDQVAMNARIDRILSALRPSPISHEDRPLELAAADNNHKALVEALEADDYEAIDDLRRLKPTDIGHVTWRFTPAVQSLVVALIDAAQSRQEGK